MPWVHFTTARVVDLRAALCANRSVRRLSVAWCGITDESVASLAPIFGKLTRLSLSGFRDLTDDATVVLARACPSLTRFDISDFGPRGFSAGNRLRGAGRARHPPRDHLA